MTVLTRQLAQAVVHWALVDAAGARIYEFNAAYTLADRLRGVHRALLDARRRVMAGRRSPRLANKVRAGAERAVALLERDFDGDAVHEPREAA